MAGGVFQGSLLDLVGQAGSGPLGESVRRSDLARGAWVDVRPGWLAGSDALFGHGPAPPAGAVAGLAAWLLVLIGVGEAIRIRRERIAGSLSLRSGRSHNSGTGFQPVRATSKREARIVAARHAPR